MATSPNHWTLFQLTKQTLNKQNFHLRKITDFEILCPALFILQGIYSLRDIQRFDINSKMRKAMQMTIQWQNIFFVSGRHQGILPYEKIHNTKPGNSLSKALFTEADHFSEVCLCYMQETHQLFVTANVRVKYAASESRWGNFSPQVLLRK